MEIEQAFDDVTPGGRKLGKFQYFLFSTVTLGQVLLACQMCLMGKVCRNKPTADASRDQRTVRVSCRP